MEILNGTIIVKSPNGDDVKVKVDNDGVMSLELNGVDIEYYAKEKNVQSGTVEFNSLKVAKITFPVAFKKHPSVTITLEDSGANHVPHREKVKTTDFRVVFKTSYTGTVGWIAIEK